MFIENLFNNGLWESSFYSFNVLYNKKKWRKIYTAYDNHDGFLFGLIDKSDGSSVTFDCDLIDEDTIYNYEWCETEYHSRLYKIDRKVLECDRFDVDIGSIKFKCILYTFRNKRFGKQSLIRGLAIGDSLVMAVNIGWKYDNSIKLINHLHPKISELLAGVSLNIDLNS